MSEISPDACHLFSLLRYIGCSLGARCIHGLPIAWLQAIYCILLHGTSTENQGYSCLYRVFDIVHFLNTFKPLYYVLSNLFGFVKFRTITKNKYTGAVTTFVALPALLSMESACLKKYTASFIFDRAKIIKQEQQSQVFKFLQIFLFYLSPKTVIPEYPDIDVRKTKTLFKLITLSFFFFFL